jgi:hypothetical protein
MKNIIILTFLMFSLISANAQDSKKKSRKEMKAEKNVKKAEETKNLVDSKTFVFDAKTVNPMGGTTRSITSPYDVRIENDSLFSYLPYFGRAYNVDYGNTESPMIFESPVKDFNAEKTKKGYTVKVKVKNGSDNLEYTFHVSETGSTMLSANSTNRQVITYYGELKKIEEKKK